jgi:hypothetical protein
MYSLRQWQTIPKNPYNLIVQASRKDGSDGIQPFPIGMGSGFFIKFHIKLIGTHSNSVLCAVNPTTDSTRRPNPINRKSILETLSANGIQNKNLISKDYFDTISSYKFVISPEGNGLDCHRHYEALIAGCIPIIERNPHIEEKYRGCPILWTTDYSEITEEYLNKMYSEMIDKYYNFSCLFLSNYPKHVQKEIKSCGNFWSNFFYKKVYYPLFG